MNKQQYVFFMLLVALFSLLTYFHDVVKEAAESPFNDFGNYWVNANILRYGANPWDCKTVDPLIVKQAEENHLTLLDAPFHSLGYFVFVLPFSMLPFRCAALAWLAVGHILLFFAVWLLLKAASGKRGFSWEDVFTVVFLVFAFWPIREQLHDGQPNFFILFLLSLCLFFLKKERYLWAGISLGVGIQFREYLGLLILFFLLKKNYRILAGILIGIVSLKALAVGLFGFDKELSYWRHIIGLFGKRAHFTMANQSLAAAICRIGKDMMGVAVCRVIGLFLSLIFIGKAVFNTRKKGNDLSGVALFLSLCFLVSAWVHESHYVALYPAIIVAWFQLQNKSSWLLRGCFMLSYLFLGLKYSFIRFPQFHSGPLAFFSAVKVWGVILLFFVLGRLTCFAYED